MIIPTTSQHPECLRTKALSLLTMKQAQEKAVQTRSVFGERSRYVIRSAITLTEPENLPGRPELPLLVYATQVEHRSMATKQGQAAMIHALAHIEFNALNLALDAIWRFPHLPDDYYQQWLSVAADEAKHFMLLNDHLVNLGYVYGSFTAHHGLWEMAELTKHHVIERMALVPRTMEARGLDASPAVRNKLKSVGDLVGASIVSLILEEEVDHVRIGNDWYHWLCNRDKVDATALFIELCKRYRAPAAKKPLNREARLLAGFTEEELNWLDS